MPHNLFNSLQEFKLASGGSGKYYALFALESAGLGKVSRMPCSLRDRALVAGRGVLARCADHLFFDVENYATNRHSEAGVRVSMLRPRFRWSSISAAQPIMRP